MIEKVEIPTPFAQFGIYHVGLFPHLYVMHFPTFVVSVLIKMGSYYIQCS